MFRRIVKDGMKMKERKKERKIQKRETYYTGQQTDRRAGKQASKQVYINRETAHEQHSLVVQFVFSLSLCFLPNGCTLVYVRDKDKEQERKRERETSSIWHIKNKTFLYFYGLRKTKNSFRKHLIGSRTNKHYSKFFYSIEKGEKKRRIFCTHFIALRRICVYWIRVWINKSFIKFQCVAFVMLKMTLWIDMHQQWSILKCYQIELM